MYSKMNGYNNYNNFRSSRYNSLIESDQNDNLRYAINAFKRTFPK